MAQELGRIDRPVAGRFQGKRKLLLVPLLYGPPTQEQECEAILHRYWEQVHSHVASLESGLGHIQHIYYESLTEGGAQGLKRLEAAGQQGYNFVQAKCQEGATLEATEDEDLLVEVMDLQRCLTLPFASGKVFRKLDDWLGESTRKRYEHISTQIDGTLQESEVALLLISERHQVQFPADMEVFYVAPPALNEFRRWFQDWLARQQKAGGETEEGQ